MTENSVLRRDGKIVDIKEIKTDEPILAKKVKMSSSVFVDYSFNALERLTLMNTGIVMGKYDLHNIGDEHIGDGFTLSIRESMDNVMEMLVDIDLYESSISFTVSLFYGFSASSTNRLFVEPDADISEDISEEIKFLISMFTSKSIFINYSKFMNKFIVEFITLNDSLYDSLNGRIDIDNSLTANLDDFSEIFNHFVVSKHWI